LRIPADLAQGRANAHCFVAYMRTLFAICAFAIAGCNGGGREASSGAVVVAPCHVAGCSSALCSDQLNVVSPCIYQPQYAGYHAAVCEPQKDGACGWTQTEQLQACLQHGGP